MTKVDVCGRCGVVFEEGLEHCRRCGADRSEHAVAREMRELCPTHTGEPTEEDQIRRDVRPIFEPSWGRTQWYERDKRKRKRQKE